MFGDTPPAFIKASGIILIVNIVFFKFLQMGTKRCLSLLDYSLIKIIQGKSSCILLYCVIASMI